MNETPERIASATRPVTGETASVRFSAVKELVPGICQACAAFADVPSAVEAPELMLVLRELLGNAIEHGSGSDSRRDVICQVAKCGPQCVELTISDDGAGFDPGTIDFQWPDQPSETGAGGLRLVHALCDALHFEHGGRRVVCRVSWNAVPCAENNRQPWAGSGRKENGL